MATPRKKNPSQKVLIAVEVEDEQVIRLVQWEEWITLPIREGDRYVSTAKTKVRVPTIVTTAEYDKVPEIEPRLSKEALWRRQKGKDIYTNQPLKWSKANVDHYIPRAKGGETVWENVGLTDPEINTMKGDKYAHEVGLQLMQPLTKLKKMLLSMRLKPDPKYPEWDPYLIAK